MEAALLLNRLASNCQRCPEWKYVCDGIIPLKWSISCVKKKDPFIPLRVFEVHIVKRTSKNMHLDMHFRLNPMAVILILWISQPT
jgi:hypothetical protein